MKQILLFGAGKSATSLIEYLLQNASRENWRLTVADADAALAQKKVGDSPHGIAVSFDVMQDVQRQAYIQQSDIVISMLPPFLHEKVAFDCLLFGRNLLTASYVDPVMQSMKEAIAKKEILFLCEMGLDPGIDHMSAMKIIDEIHANGGKIVSFKSHCGGLVAPENDDNPWHYKISWNPRNIVLAGKSGALLKIDNLVEKIPYESLFDNDELIHVEGLADYACYANRDSLSYIPLYGLEEASTFVRTTLRHPSFCKAWNYVVKAGLTHESSNPFLSVGYPTFTAWFNHTVSSNTPAKDYPSFLKLIVEERDRKLVDELFRYLGLCDEEKIPSTAKSSADVLQLLVESRLALKPHDRDMIVMLHEFDYTTGSETKRISSSLVVKGEDSLRTAMSKTVGLPLGIATKFILNGTIRSKGLQIPVLKDIYEPVLQELQSFDIRFNEREL